MVNTEEGLCFSVCIWSEGVTGEGGSRGKVKNRQIPVLGDNDSLLPNLRQVNHFPEMISAMH